MIGPITFVARLAAVGVTLLALVAWVKPSNIPKLISKEEFILLGRYGIDHFHAATILTLLSLVCIYLAFSPPHSRRQRRMVVMTCALSGALALFSADLVLRLVFDDAAYEHVGELRLRPANRDFQLHYEDRPLAHRSSTGAQTRLSRLRHAHAHRRARSAQ
jgi:hypothetical protein